MKFGLFDSKEISWRNYDSLITGFVFKNQFSISKLGSYLMRANLLGNLSGMRNHSYELSLRLQKPRDSAQKQARALLGVNDVVEGQIDSNAVKNAGGAFLGANSSTSRL